MVATRPELWFNPSHAKTTPPRRARGVRMEVNEKASAAPAAAEAGQPIVAFKGTMDRCTPAEGAHTDKPNHAVAAQGVRESATASGDFGAATASGYCGAATASGYCGAATASGDCGAATASGYCRSEERRVGKE